MQCGRPVASLHRRRHPRQGPHTPRKLSNSAAGVVNMSLSMETSDSSEQWTNARTVTASSTAPVCRTNPPVSVDPSPALLESRSRVVNVDCVRATSSASTNGSPLPEGTAIKDNPVLPRLKITLKTGWVTCQNRGCHWYFQRLSPAELTAIAELAYMRYPHSGPYPHFCPFK